MHRGRRQLKLSTSFVCSVFVLPTTYFVRHDLSPTHDVQMLRVEWTGSPTSIVPDPQKYCCNLFQLFFDSIPYYDNYLRHRRSGNIATAAAPTPTSSPTTYDTSNGNNNNYVSSRRSYLRNGHGHSLATPRRPLRTPPSSPLATVSTSPRFVQLGSAGAGNTGLT